MPTARAPNERSVCPQF